MWFSWQTQSGSYPQLIANPTTNGFQIYYDVSGGLLAVGIFNVSNVITYTISQTALSGAWNHLAVTRSGNTFRLFINGVLQANGTNSISFASVTTQYIGSDGSRPYTGYLSNVRTVLGAIPTPYQTSSTTNGTAVFTPPNGALQAITSTALLTCAYSTFRDGSSNAFTITVNGAVVSTQNPFPLTTLPNPAQGNAGNGIFSMSQYQSLKQQNLWPGFDPYFENTTLLLHGNGTNGAQNNTFLDSSTNNFTITRNGNTTQGTFTPYGSNWSNYFDGSSNLQISNNAAFRFDTGDFTIEFWLYYNGSNWAGSNQSIASQIASDTVTGWGLFRDAAGTGIAARLGSSLSNYITLFTGSTPATGVWEHYALVRNSSTITWYKNGVNVASTTAPAGNLSDTTQPFYVSNTQWGAKLNNGYISNLRIVKGTAVYTSAFTPPTGPLTAITNTSLLTCQSNRFIDNSSNAFAITVTGSPSVQRFSPFNPSAPYAAGTIGGSGYFDGSGDYLSGPNNAAFAFGTGDFTIEAWVNSTNYSGTNAIFDSRSAGNEATGVILYIRADGKPEMYRSAAVITGSTALSQNTWNHVALTRSGSTCTLWLNGVSIGTATDTTNLTQQNSFVGAAYTGVNNLMVGYIANLRVVKGTAVYTTTFTPPTSPLTAITNTSLLLSFTNGGIIDNAMMNDLETVGNAQISTTQSKFGGSSMYFDGSGDYLVGNANAPVLDSGLGQITIEGWFYLTANVANGAFGQVVGPIGLSGTSGLAFGFFGSGGTTRVGASYVSTGYSGTVAISLNTWTHVAWVLTTSTTLKTYINGTIADTFTLGGTQNVKGISVGAGIGGASPITGYIDDLRITKGIARYTSNFTPQTSQWQDQ